MVVPNGSDYSAPDEMQLTNITTNCLFNMLLDRQLGLELDTKIKYDSQKSNYGPTIKMSVSGRPRVQQKKISRHPSSNPLHPPPPPSASADATRLMDDPTVGIEI